MVDAWHPCWSDWPERWVGAGDAGLFEHDDVTNLAITRDQEIYAFTWLVEEMESIKEWTAWDECGGTYAETQERALAESVLQILLFPERW